MRIWLDDLRPSPGHNWTVAHNVDEAKYKILKYGVWFEFISLDHDLGENLTGYDLVKWMAENDIWPSQGIAIHTANPVGRENMKAIINKYSPFHLY